MFVTEPAAYDALNQGAMQKQAEGIELVLLPGASAALAEVRWQGRMPEKDVPIAGYTTYQNIANPHVTIHIDGCGQVMKRGGERPGGKGSYSHHKDYAAAKMHAEKTGRFGGGQSESHLAAVRRSTRS
jgi:hypothetical protein